MTVFDVFAWYVVPLSSYGFLVHIGMRQRQKWYVIFRHALWAPLIYLPLVWMLRFFWVHYGFLHYYADGEAMASLVDILHAGLAYGIFLGLSLVAYFGDWGRPLK